MSLGLNSNLTLLEFMVSKYIAKKHLRKCFQLQNEGGFIYDSEIEVPKEVMCMEI
jgi:hypothetical protein